MLRLVGGIVVLGAALLGAAVVSAAPSATGRTTGAVEYPLDWTSGSVSISIAARGNGASASGRLRFRRVAEGFDANAHGDVTCYVQVGKQTYFSGEFDRTFLSGPTEITRFYGTVVDGGTGPGADRAFVTITDGNVRCDEPGIMAFLDSSVANSFVTHGNITVR